MTKLRRDSVWLRDFGCGTTADEAEAHDYTADEAHVLQQLWPDYYADSVAQSDLYDRKQPPFPAGEGRIWVRYKNTWLAVERQAAFLGTRNALQSRAAKEESA